ncbi:DUF4202 domain-containing protein [Nitrosomonas marina]|uniref:DUF4202 domain-containing protein n=1 Tax=Nitrosomonas marina TaxID=917 RepID=A0A1H8B3R5_9PROT|nr:DUF4202 domain-containing protein [Nitrosomonas marina]SEM76734.1 protein of unknown function [Nitrosomonas marina]
MTDKRFNIAIAMIDAVNSEDPNMETSDDKNWPKELLYAQRMSQMLERYAPEAGDAVRLAARAQHIQRWKVPRNDYPLDRKGYHQWRTALNMFHADTVASLLEKAGYDQDFITRVKRIISKRSLKTNSESQLLEDVAGLVFLEHYLVDFVARHPEYDEIKWNDIIRRIWNKLSERAHRFVQAGQIKLPALMNGRIGNVMRE